MSKIAQASFTYSWRGKMLHKRHGSRWLKGGKLMSLERAPTILYAHRIAQAALKDGGIAVLQYRMQSAEPDGRTRKSNGFPREEGTWTLASRHVRGKTADELEPILFREDAWRIKKILEDAGLDGIDVGDHNAKSVKSKPVLLEVLNDEEGRLSAPQNLNGFAPITASKIRGIFLEYEGIRRALGVSFGRPRSRLELDRVKEILGGRKRVLLGRGEE
jgi:hypothetical protein